VVDESSEQQAAAKTSSAATTTVAEPTRGFCSGGLIVNAELARFIQEQASQVAARQSSQLTSSVAPFPTDRSSVNAGQRSDGSTSAAATSSSSHLSSRSLFRKNLPPRFLRRLHAEQQEREMKENSVSKLKGLFRQFSCEVGWSVLERINSPPNFYSCRVCCLRSHLNTQALIPHDGGRTSSCSNSFSSFYSYFSFAYCSFLFFLPLPLNRHRLHLFFLFLLLLLLLLLLLHLLLLLFIILFLLPPLPRPRFISPSYSLFPFILFLPLPPPLPPLLPSLPFLILHLHR
ncbi:unnamed protein product, partial [Dibothriocephalus latus]